MSDNKFIERLKGKETAKSVLEVKNQATKLSFANMPQGTSNAIDVFSDHRGNATAVLNGTTNWKISNSSLILANTVSGDGQDFLSTYSVSGTGLWVNSSYTFPSTGDPRHPIAMVFNPSTKWVLKVCGDNLIVDGGSTIDFTMLVKIGTANVYSKNFTVRESAGQFSKEFVIDFGEANLDIVKAGGLSTLTVQLLCGTANASARIYNGMSVLTCLQRKVDASAVSNNGGNVEDVLNGNMVPVDYFSNPAFIDQIEDGDEAYAVFTRDGDNVDLSGWAQPIPDQANNAGKFLTTDGSDMSWEQIEISNVDGLQTELTDLQDQINDKVNETSTANQVYGTDNNGDQTTYDISDLGPGDFTGATAGDAGTNGLVPAPAAGDQAKFLQGDGTWANPTAATAWGNITGTLSNQTDLQSALNAKQDTLTAGTNISITGTTISATDTTYTGSNGITLTGTNFINSGVRSVATGTTSGTISVDINGTSTDVAVNGWSGKADVATTLAGYGITDGANTDLSNLTSVGQNISNWSNNVTNCITEIPQDIKLELNNGTLTLKAGSKVYVPNGAGVFDTITLTGDKTGTQTTNDTRMYFYNGTYIEKFPITQCFSGSSAPSGYQYMFWYDTTNNVVKKTSNSGSTWESGWSLPFCISTASGGALTSIDQIFNGFGYIGSTVFALPGLKVIKPNGRNTDGSLKNDSFTVNNVRTRTNESVSGEMWYVFDSGNYLSIASPSYWYYNDAKNLFEAYSGGNTMSFCVFASSQTTGGVISGWNPKQVFHAVDYNDFAKHELIEFALPTSANNYTWYRKYKDGWVEQGRKLGGTTQIAYGSSGNLGTFTFPIPMANANYFKTATANGYCYLMQWDNTSTTSCKPLFGAYTVERTLSNVFVYVCGMAAS